MLQRAFRFYFTSLQSPTYYNLNTYLLEKNWRRTRFNCLADFSERHFQFSVRVAETLEFKNELARLISVYCPEVMPVTFCIDDKNALVILEKLALHYSWEQVNHIAWILKPALLNNGKHIKIFRSLNAVWSHYMNAQRLGGPHVLQEYIMQPHLLKDHKYTIRMFVILTSDMGSFIYPHGYFNVATHPFQADDVSHLCSHLTNEHLKEDETNVIQIPTERFEFFPDLYLQIKNIISEVINGLQQRFPEAFKVKSERRLAIFGFDFLVDTMKRVWLLEANHGPCFPISDTHPLQKYLYADFWRAFIDNFVLPISKRESAHEIRYGVFEKIG